VITPMSLDRELETRVLGALATDSDLAPPRVVVHLDGTRATLKGAVATWAQHEAAERAALATPGITAVDNQLCLLVKARLSDELHELTP
jgi:osmotically-inducible protein OsmY